MSENLLNITVKSPFQKEPFKISISPLESVSSIKQYLISLGQIAQPLTCFSLRNADNIVLDPFLTITECDIKDGDSLAMHQENYTEAEILLHIQQTRELLGFIQDQSPLPIVNAGALNVVDFKPQKSKPKKKETVSAADPPDLPLDMAILGYDPRKTGDEFPQTLIAKPNTLYPSPVARTLHFSCWQPVTFANKLQGDLAYLKFTSEDHKTFHITAHVRGFVVNSSTDEKFDRSPRKNGGGEHVSLLHLLGQISPRTLNAVERSNNQLSKVVPMAWMSPRATFLAANWLVEDKPTVRPDIARTQNFTERDSLKEWNEDFQAARELPKTDENGAPSVRDRIIREKLLVNTCFEFAQAATKGAVDIIEGNMLAFNSNEPAECQIFLRNGIFYTYGFDSVGVYTDLGGDEAARVAANKDLRGVEQLLHLDMEGVTPVLTTIVDYCGRRIVAQGPVPGIFRDNVEPQIVYGSSEGREKVYSDEATAKTMSKISDFFHLKEHKAFAVDGEKVPLHTSVDMKAMMGTDGRKYVLDCYRLTPPDIGFLEDHPDYPHRLALIRPEAISEWFKAKIQDDLEAQGEDAKLDQEKISEYNKKFRLNPDVYLTDIPEDLRAEYDEDRKAVREVSEFIKTRLITRFLEDLSTSVTTYPIDGTQLAQVMHRRGINMRYLGEIYKRAEDPVCASLREVVVQEAIARSIKHKLNAKLRHIALLAVNTTVVDYLKAIDIDDIKDDVKIRFDIDLDSVPDFESYFTRGSLLREVSIKLGFQWSPEVFNGQGEVQWAKLSVDQLKSFVPKVRYSSVHSVIAEEALDAGRASVHNDEKDVGIDLVTESLSLHEQVYGFVNAETARAYNQASLVFHELSNYEQAADLCRKAIAIAERTTGIDSCETIVMYINLAFFERARGNMETALDLSLHVLQIWRAIGFPGHPDLATAINNIAIMLQQSRFYSQSIPLFEYAVASLGKSYGKDDIQLAPILFQLSQSQLMEKDFKASTRSMEHAFSIYKAVNGADDENTKECKKWLDHLVSATIKDLKAPKMIPTKIKIEPTLKKKQSPKMSRESVNDVVKYIMSDDKKKSKKKKKKNN